MIRKFFYDYKNADKKINELNKAISIAVQGKEELHNTLKSTGYEECIKTSAISNLTEQRAIELICNEAKNSIREYIEHLKNQINKYIEIKIKADYFFQMLTIDEMTFVELYYFNNKRFDYLPALMNYSRRTIYRIKKDVERKYHRI